MLAGQAAFVQPNTVSVTGPNGNLTASADTVFIANGSRGSRIPQLPWDNPLSDKWLYDADSIQDIGRLPEHLVIQGSGIIGVNYGFIMRRLGARVTIILRETHVLDGKGTAEGCLNDRIPTWWVLTLGSKQPLRTGSKTPAWTCSTRSGFLTAF